MSFIRLGVLGIDSSHLPEFSKRINTLYGEGKTRCKVTSFCDAGNHQLPAGDVAKWREQTLELGVKEVPTFESVLEQSDGVLVLAVGGNRHAELAMPSLARGLPTYVDKPLTLTLTDAQQILAAARQSGAPCYSASSLRFAAEVTALPREKIGEILSIDAFGPGELLAANPGLFHYGVHTLEMVDALATTATAHPQVQAVRATTSADRDLLDLQFDNGTHAHLRLERSKAAYAFGATVHGSKAVHAFTVDFADVYNRLVQGMVRFFEGGPPPAALEHIVENIATLEAAQEAMKDSGKWVSVSRA